MIAPPYSSEFVQLFLPIVRNEEITGSLRNAERTDDVSNFIGRFALTGVTSPHYELNTKVLIKK